MHLLCFVTLVVSRKELKRRLIVDGEVRTTAAPWFIASAFAGCAGVILSENIVMTAAHCEPAFKLNSSILAGHVSTNLPVSGIGVQVEATWTKHSVVSRRIHPLYVVIDDDVMSYYDMMLMRIEPNFTFDSVLMAANLPSKKPDHGNRVRLSGFGKYKYRSVNDTVGKLSQDLRETNGTVINVGACYNDVEHQNGCHTNEGNATCSLCVMEDKTSCQGDSGTGAIFQECGRNVVLGVLSAGFDDVNSHCDQDAPATYSNAWELREWIKETWEELSPGSYREPQKCSTDKISTVSIDLEQENSAKIKQTYTLTELLMYVGLAILATVLAAVAIAGICVCMKMRKTDVPGSKDLSALPVVSPGAAPPVITHDAGVGSFVTPPRKEDAHDAGVGSFVIDAREEAAKGKGGKFVHGRKDYPKRRKEKKWACKDGLASAASTNWGLMPTDLPPPKHPTNGTAMTSIPEKEFKEEGPIAPVDTSSILAEKVKMAMYETTNPPTSQSETQETKPYAYATRTPEKWQSEKVRSEE